MSVPSVDEVLASYKDSDRVTVLHGFGKLKPDRVEYVDNYKFVGGVCRDVPFSIAKHWLQGTRPDGKPAVSHVDVIVLGNESTEADYVTVTGMPRLSEEELVASVKAANLERLLELLGQDGFERLVRAINERKFVKGRK